MSTLRKVNDGAPAQESKANRATAEDAASDYDETVSNPVDEESPSPETILAETDRLLFDAASANPLEESLSLETGTVTERPLAEFAEITQPAAADDLTDVAADDYVPVDTVALAASGNEQLSPGDASAETSKQKTAATPVADISLGPKHNAPVQNRPESDSHAMQDRPKFVRTVTSEKIVPSDSTPDGGDDHPEASEARIREQTAAPNAAKTSTARPADWRGTPATSATPGESPVLSSVVGRPDKKIVSMTNHNRPEPKVTVEATTEGQTRSTEGQVEAQVPRDSIPAEKPMASNRFVRPAASEATGRPDWLPPVERVDQTPLNRFSPSMTVAKEDASLSTASFRENNIAQIVERVAVSVRGGQSEARIALKPDHLGSLRVQITTENNTVSIKIMTEFSMARDLLEHHLPQLKMELQQQGLEVEKFDVSLSEDQQNLSRHGRRQPNTSAARPNTGSRDENADEQTDEETADRAAGQQPKAVGVDFFA